MQELSHGFQDNAVPVLFEVQEGFVWPHFILSEAVLLSAGFTSISPDIRFNIFRFNLGHWTVVKINHVLELKDSPPRIFVKAIHVQHCQDFTKFLLSTSSATSPSLRTNLAGERTYVKKRMVEYAHSQSQKSRYLKNKHSLSQSPESLPSTPKRQRITSEFVDSFSINTPSPASSPAPSIYQSASATSSSTSSSTNIDPATKQEMLDLTIPSLPFLISKKRVSKKPKWPADFFSVKIADCFDEIEDNATDMRVRSIFERHFGQWVSYKRSTFYEHRQRWVGASLEAKDAVLSAGCTKAGCWVNFMSMTAPPRAHVKAVRKHLLEPEVIDISSGSDHEL